MGIVRYPECFSFGGHDAPTVSWAPCPGVTCRVFHVECRNQSYLCRHLSRVGIQELSL